MLSLLSSMRSTGFVLLGSTSLLLAGCGAGVNAGDIVQTNVPNPAIHGTLIGGQNPITGATVSVYAFGTGGYGSAATQLGSSVTTDSNGAFSFPSNAYTCPQSNTPVYILSKGGNTGAGTNANAVLGAALGTCTQAQSSSIVLNEVTTVALAYALSHYFDPTFTSDSFGGPSVTLGGPTAYSRGLVLANSYMTSLIAVNQGGLATQASGNLLTEDQKVYTIANVLAGCVNSTGITGPTDTSSNCARLFASTAYTPQVGGATLTATDTLQAAVLLALHPVLSSTVNNRLYNLGGTNPPFNYQYNAAPIDWSLAVSFTATGLGMGVDPNTLSTIDIDVNNRIWFPSTIAGGTGIAYFDPTTRSFSSVINTTGMFHPNQLAIDNSGNAWVSDTQGTTVSAYNTSNPNTGATAFTLANTKSYTLAIATDSSIRVGLYDTTLGKYRIGTIPSTTGTYTELATPALLAGYQPYSMAFDNANNLGLTQFLPSTPRFYNSQLTPGGVYTSNVSTAADNAGQIVWNGDNLIGVRSYNNVSGAGDGICVDPVGTAATTAGSGTCYSVKTPNYNLYTGAAGAVVDGAQTIWIANQQNNSVTSIPLYSGSTYNQTVGTAQQVQSYLYTHNSSNGATLTNPEAVAVDNAGNLWVANAGCTTAGCTPNAFVLSVLIGAATPAITPVATQTAGGASLTGTEPQY